MTFLKNFNNIKHSWQFRLCYLNGPPLRRGWFRLRPHITSKSPKLWISDHSTQVYSSRSFVYKLVKMSDSDSTKKASRPKTTPTHPPVAVMVMDTIRTLKDRKGTSLIAIKKYISDNYHCDAEKLAPFIRKFLRKAVVEERVVKVKASYKLSAAEKAAKPKKESKTVKKTSEKKEKSTTKKVKGTPKKKTKKVAEDKSPKKKKVVKKVKKAGEKEEKPKKVKKAKETTKVKKMKSPAKKTVKSKKSTDVKKSKTPKKTTKKPSKA